MLIFLYDTINKMTEQLLLIKESGANLINPSIIQEKYNEMCNAKTIYETAIANKNKAESMLDELEMSYDKMKSKANIPDGCTFNNCSLRNTVNSRLNDILDQINKVKITKNEYIKTENEYSIKSTELCEFLKPYMEYKLVHKFNEICRNLRTYFGYKCTDEEFIDLINIKGTLLGTELTRLVDGSIAYDKYIDIKNKRDNLSTKLNTLIQSSNVSAEFITSELNKLQNDLDVSIAKLNKTNDEISLLKEEYTIYQEYRTTYTKSLELKDRYTKLERALIVNKAYEYWNSLYTRLCEYSSKLDSDLRELDILVTNQDNIRYSYQK